MATNICSGCQIDTEIVVDHRARSALCSRCGLSVETNLFGEIPQLMDSEDAVEISVETENPANAAENSPTPTSSSNSNDSKVVKATSKKALALIEVMSGRLELTTEITDRAREIFHAIDIMRTCRGRSMNLISAACIFIACKEKGSSRTLNELSVVANGASKKLINRTAESIKKQFDGEDWTVLPDGLVQRICTKFGLGKRATKAVEEAVLKVQELDIRRSPNSVLSAVIYMVLELCRGGKTPPTPVKDIAVVMDVTEVTIKKAFNDIMGNGSRVIPEWYASQGDVEKIPCP